MEHSQFLEPHFPHPYHFPNLGIVVQGKIAAWKKLIRKEEQKGEARTRIGLAEGIFMRAATESLHIGTFV